jgi:hypothetical protein
MAKRPINLLISEPADTRLRTLAAHHAQPLSLIVERAILAYQPDDNPASETTTMTALADRITALEATINNPPVIPAVRPVPAASGAVMPPAPPTGGQRSAKAALRDPAIIELRKQGLLCREIQTELIKRGIYANGKNGQPAPISTGLISTVLKKAGL